MANKQNESKPVEFRNEPAEFRNEGLMRWEELRAEWLRPKNQSESKQQKAAKDKNKQQREINAEDIAERIFSQNGGWQLAEPVPLSDMVDILIDFWQDEGLYE